MSFFKRFLHFFAGNRQNISHDPKLTEFLKNHPFFRRMAFFIHENSQDVKGTLKKKFEDALKKEDKLKTIDDAHKEKQYNKNNTNNTNQNNHNKSKDKFNRH